MSTTTTTGDIRVSATTTPRTTSPLLPGGWLLIVGSLTMFIGAALWGAAGADLWTAIADADFAAYADAAAANSGLAYANVSVWSLGVVAMAIGGTVLAATGRGWLATAARTTYTLAAAMAVAAFLAMATAIHLSVAGASVDSIEAMGFFGARLDDIATALLVGLAPVLLAGATRAAWAPTWLTRFAVVAVAVGVLSVVVLFAGPADLGSLIIPVGLGWNIAAGVVALRVGRVER